MKVSQWAEIRRLVEVEKLSRRAVAQRLRCCHTTVARALCMEHPPDEKHGPPRGSLLDPYKPKIDALLARYPQLSAARVLEEIRRGPEGYRGQLTLVRTHLRNVRPRRGRVYQEVEYEPGQAMQIDWGHCGQIRIGSTQRRVVATSVWNRLPASGETRNRRGPWKRESVMSSEMRWPVGRMNLCPGTTIDGLLSPGVMKSPTCGCIKPQGSDRSIDSRRSPESCVRCRNLFSIPTKWSRRLSVPMHASTSTGIVIRFPRT